MNNKQRSELAQWVVDHARKSGADEVAASISNQRDIEIEFRDKQLDKLKESTQNSLNLDIYIQNRYSSHSTCDLKKETLTKFIEEAVASTKYLTKDEFRSLPDPKYYPKKASGDLKIKDDFYKNVESSKRKKIAEEIEKSAMAQSDQIISSTSGYSDSSYESVKVHSNGFLGESSGTWFSAGAEVTVNDKNGGRPEDWAWSTVRFYNDLPSPEDLGKEAAKRALQKIGQKKMESGKYAMLVENRAGGRLLGMLRTPMTARSLQQKSSYLEGMIGKKIASEKLSWIDDPFVEKGLGSGFYDGEGLALKKRVLIDKGVLKEYLIDNYYGKKLGLEPNSGSTSNIVFEYGKKSLDDMVKGIKKGILVNSFIGGNSNSTTGDFSYGIIGLLIENGKITQPVNEMNISGNGKEFWNQLVEVGNDPYIYSAWRRPSMLFEDINFSGI